MAGKRKPTHWAVRRKNKQARAGEDDASGESKKARKNEGVDRRAGFSDTIHPGSYAAQRKAALAATDASIDSTAAAASDAVKDEEKPPKRRYGIWLAFCGKNYSGMQMYVHEPLFAMHERPAGHAPSTTHSLVLSLSLVHATNCRNEGVKTIEAEVERALFEAGAIAEVNYGFLQKVRPPDPLALIRSLP